MTGTLGGPPTPDRLRAVTTRPLYVHVGASKTGTSSLQRGLWNSEELLAGAGVGLPFVGRQPHVREVLRPLGWVMGSGFVEEPRPRKVRALAARLRDTPGDRLLMSNEDLCEMPADRVGILRELFADADLDLRVVLSARDWSLQLPSEWQQLLKHRLTDDYPSFLAAVRDRRGWGAEHFWLRQDAADICRRWGTGLDPGKVHVIAVPSRSEDEDGVFRLFGEVVGFPGLELNLPRNNVNASFGYTEAEVLRRLNVALGERLPDYRSDYVPAVRTPLAQGGVLARSASGRISLPPEHLPWVQAEGRRQLAELRAAGHALHGAVEGLVPGDDAGRELPPLDEAEIADAAVRSLATFAVKVHQRTG